MYFKLRPMAKRGALFKHYLALLSVFISFFNPGWLLSKLKEELYNVMYGSS